MLQSGLPRIIRPTIRPAVSLGLFSSLFALCIFLFIYSFSFTEGSAHIDWLRPVLLLFLLSSLLLAAGFLVGRKTSARAYEHEMKLYKEFTHMLHSAAAEDDIYAILYDYLRVNPLKIKVSVNYTHASEEENWTTFSNAEKPICLAEPGKCPLLEEGGEMKVNNLAGNLQCPYLSREYRKGSCYCAGISTREHTKSLLLLYSSRKNTFNRLQLSKIKSYLEVTRLLLNNRRTFRMLDRKVHTDSLTGLYNRSFLDSYLETQLEASMLSGKPLSLIIADIDHFKTINDTYGHQAGDFVLTGFSGLVLGALRKSDVMIRYGGDEFIIILPHTRLEGARIIAEKIRNAAASREIPVYQGVQLPQVTCSLGIACYPELAATGEELLKKADQALYNAKNSGRNRVCASQR